MDGHATEWRSRFITANVMPDENRDSGPGFGDSLPVSSFPFLLAHPALPDRALVYRASRERPGHQASIPRAGGVLYASSILRNHVRKNLFLVVFHT